MKNFVLLKDKVLSEYDKAIIHIVDLNKEEDYSSILKKYSNSEVLGFCNYLGAIDTSVYYIVPFKLEDNISDVVNSDNYSGSYQLLAEELLTFYSGEDKEDKVKALVNDLYSLSDTNFFWFLYKGREETRALLRKEVK